MCNKEADHRGRHTSVAWQCDFCGRMRTGRAAHIDAYGRYCFMCIHVLHTDEEPDPYEPIFDRVGGRYL